MHDLTLVGVHDDGEHLVLTSADGQRYRLPIDEAVRAAVRRDRARLGQLQLEMDGRMRPKDIQARIRAGQTAEEIAEQAGLPIEHVRRFEGAVLAEREFVARQARSVTLRRSAPAAVVAPSLEDLVTERLEQREADQTSITWDAWRQEDGRWTVVLTFSVADRARSASWSYHPSHRQLTPLDDEARWLTESDPEEAAARRLTAVQGPVFAIGADGDLLRPTDHAGADEDDGVPGATVGLLDSLRERRGRRMRPVSPEDEDGEPDAVQEALEALRDSDGAAAAKSAPGAGDDQHGGVSGDGSQGPLPRSAPQPGRSGQARRQPPGRASRHPAGSRMPVPSPAAPPPTSAASGRDERSRDEGPQARGSGGERVVVLPDAGGEGQRRAAPGRVRPLAPAPATADESTSETSSETGPPTPRKARRASVPSWDDIVFGARRE